jgi:hypothetical protein
MAYRLAVVFVAICTAPPVSAEIRSFLELLDAMTESQVRGAEGVSDYAMDLEMLGHPTTHYYERAQIVAADGAQLDTFRLVPFDEIQRRQQVTSGMTPDAWQAYADGLRQTGDALGSEMDRGMANAGLPPGLLREMGPDATGPNAEPWASPDPRVMMGAMAGFADAAATAEPSPDGTADAAAAVDQMARFARRAEIVGRESIDGRSAYHARAEDLNMTQSADGQELVIRSLSLWVDAEKLVPLEMRMDGIAKQNGESREIFIEKLDRDYRTVPGSNMVMPYRSVIRMGGVLSPKEQKEMEKAREELAEFDRQLESMPPDQRAMVESRMGSQMEMMRRMVNGGAVEVETIVRAIRVNEGISGALGTAWKTAPGGGIDPSWVEADPAEEPAPKTTLQDDAALQQAREACLQEKAAERRAAQKKKKRFGKMFGSLARVAGRHGGSDVASDVARVSADVYDANATAQDLSEAAEALGITEDDIAACENPS